MLYTGAIKRSYSRVGGDHFEPNGNRNGNFIYFFGILKFSQMTFLGLNGFEV